MGGFNTLEKNEKRRLIIFIVIMLVLIYFAVGYSYEVSKLIREAQQQMSHSGSGDIYIDGADFSWFFIPMQFAVNGFISTILIGSYEIIIIIFSALFLGIFRAAAFRNTIEVQQEEYKLGKKIWLILSIASTVVSVLLMIRAGFTGIVTGVAFNLPVFFFSCLFYVWPLKKRTENTDKVI